MPIPNLGESIHGKGFSASCWAAKALVGWQKVEGEEFAAETAFGAEDQRDVEASLPDIRKEILKRASKGRVRQQLSCHHNYEANASSEKIAASTSLHRRIKQAIRRTDSLRRGGSTLEHGIDSLGRGLPQLAEGPKLGGVRSGGVSKGCAFVELCRKGRLTEAVWHWCDFCSIVCFVP